MKSLFRPHASASRAASVMRASPASPAMAAMAALAALVLSGCVIAPARPYRGGAVVYSEAEIEVAPPAPQVEVVGVAPVPGYLWIGGFWNWTGGRHVWVGGHWSAPRPGYFWVPNRWERTRHGWRQHPGHWQR